MKNSGVEIAIHPSNHPVHSTKLNSLLKAARFFCFSLFTNEMLLNNKLIFPPIETTNSKGGGTQSRLKMIGARAIKQSNSGSSRMYSNFEFESFTQMTGDFHLLRRDFCLSLVCQKEIELCLMTFLGLKHRLSKNWSK